MKTYDVIIIGSGQAGTPLATACTAAGKKTALVEEKHVAGTCINEGCTPTKTMVASARMAYLARRAADYGVLTGPVSVDLRKVRQRKDEIVTSFRGGSEGRIKKGNVDLITGRARFSGPKTLEVTLNDGGTTQIGAETIIINTGDRPSVPDLQGLDQISYLDSTSIMDLDQVPEHLLILGGGYVALEFGQMFRRFGSQVTIVARSSQLLGREDPDVAAAVLEILQADGIEVLLDADARQIKAGPNGGLEMSVKTPAGMRNLTGSHLLAATGRTPNSDGLNLPAAGIKMDEHGNIQTNEFLETSSPGIYAVGDVKGGPAFTHISYDDYRILKTNLLDGGKASIKGRMIPYTLFIDPQLGRIGMTEQEAAKSGRAVQVAKMPINYVARALEVDESRGFMKAVVDKETKQILGAAILGIEGGELMAMIEIAMMGKLPYTALRDAIFAHPTLAESLNNLFANFQS